MVQLINFTLNNSNNITVNIGDFLAEHEVKSIKSENDTECKNIIEFMELYISEVSERPNGITGIRLSKGRIKSLNLVLNKLKQYFLKEQIPGWDNLGMEFYYSFYKWLEHQNYSVNYIGKIISIIKTVLNDAYEKGILKNNDFKSRHFKVYNEESEEIYLSIQELKSIIDLDLLKLPKIYSIVRDVFIIGAFTGLRVSDYKRLKTENLIKISGVKMIRVATKKTGTKVIIPMHPFVENILNKHQDIPTIHENRINLIIKKIGNLAGINNSITKTITKGGKKYTYSYKKFERIMSHTARRSFCTNAYLSGLDSLDIMAISGHKTESSFLKYIKITKEQRALRIAKHPFFNTKNLD